MTYSTGKRNKIIEYLMKNGEKAYSLEQICAAVTQDGRGRSTVYRLMSSLVDEGLVRRLADGKTRHVTYQYVGGRHCSEHLHLKCMECGRLIHLGAEASRRVGQTLIGSENFVIDTGAFLYGRCSGCNVKGGF